MPITYAALPGSEAPLGSDPTSWRYIASRLHGDGTETFLDWNLPLSAVGITNTLSGPDAITASINPEVAALKVDGSPLIQPWSTAIYAERDGQIQCGAIITDTKVEGPLLTLACVGFPGYAKDMPYTSEYSGVQVDPLDVVRHIWTHIQAAPGGNIGLRVDSLLTGLEIGTVAENVDFTTSGGEVVSFVAGPVKFAWYQTTDLGGEIDTLAKETPFDFRELHVWVGDGTIDHRLRLGYPTLGRRRDDLRFVVGENVQIIPTVAFGVDYASEVLELGAGEGRSMIRGTSGHLDSRLRRVAVVSDKSITTTTSANTLAAIEALSRSGLAGVTEVTVSDHPHAPLGSFDVGDEILVQTGPGWADDLALWCRITAITISPDSLGVARLSLQGDGRGIGDAVDRVAAKLIRLEQNVNALSTTPQLANSSIEDGGAIVVNSPDGTPMAYFGGQADGSYMANSVNGPIPPQPTIPIVTAGPGTLTIRWDGLFASGEPTPMDFSRVEIHASTDAAFDARTSLTLLGTIESPRGGESVFVLSMEPWYVRLITRSLSGNASDASDDGPGPNGTVVGTPLSVVSDAEIAAINAAVVEAKAAGDNARIVGDQALLDAASAQAVGDAAEATGIAASYAANNITSTQIMNGAITTPKITAGAVVAGSIAAGAITAAHIEAGAITAGKLAANAVTAGNIAVHAVVAGNIAADSIYAFNIIAGNVTADKLGVNSVVAGAIAAQAVTADKIQAGAITAGKISATAINGHWITGSTFSTAGGSGSRVEIGLSGGYSTDQIRFYNGYGGAVSSIRNPDNRPGCVRLSTYDGSHTGIFDFFTPYDGNPCIQFGGGLIKSVLGYSTLQVRDAGDAGYAPINASIFNVMSAVKLKKNVTPLTVDALALVANNGLHSWDMDTPAATGGIGLIADNMPDWIRSEDGYDVAGAVAILWEAVKQLDAKTKESKV